MRIGDDTFEKNRLEVLLVLVPREREGRSGRLHSDAFFKKVLSSKLTKLGEELCDNRNAKDDVVSCWAEGVRRSKTQVFLSKPVFCTKKSVFDDFASCSGCVVLDQGTTWLNNTGSGCSVTV